MATIRNYKDLLVWQRGMTLVEEVYRVAKQLPRTEIWGLTSQMRRAAVSIPSNIAEGYGRQTAGEYTYHLCVSRGSLLELETQLLLTERLGFLKNPITSPLLTEIDQQNRMLSSLISKVRQS